MVLTTATASATTSTATTKTASTAKRPGALAHWLAYPKVARIQRKAAEDVGRGSETLMTFARGDLFKAARRFAEGKGHKALVVTGFFIPKAEHPAAESDGPVGAAEICAAIRAIGGDAWMVSDAWCEPVIRGAAKDVLPDDRVLIAPKGDAFDNWLDQTRKLVEREHIDTVIFIERVGPARDGYPRNMRGINIQEWTAPLSRLAGLGLHTVGIGDGGNEIGMGHIQEYAIEDIVDHGEDIACTVPTEELIVAGCSNWGGHAFVCSLYAMGCTQVAAMLDDRWHKDVIANITAAGGLDGVKLLNIPTVDGLSERQYYAQINAISQLAR
ncbi:DUF4392 domain-containing protein [Bifidobacterium amazonense]|uniref:DUF4392 domain-containing protein n=1 Tax=Bifidobacterium amazonense TaxID=2809027 RepID=A0ABS9VWJ3_9BIFI|nr:glutamate cyclase domain-containing protein [Bifidobacterium amazonense]MCH9276452.1 DUF4392 domain-containing protein [Bifidobacterium amazonense]